MRVVEHSENKVVIINKAEFFNMFISFYNVTFADFSLEDADIEHEQNTKGEFIIRLFLNKDLSIKTVNKNLSKKIGNNPIEEDDD